MLQGVELSPGQADEENRRANLISVVDAETIGEELTRHISAEKSDT